MIRGGSGLYYGDALGGDQSFARGNVQIARDPRSPTTAAPNFTADPLNGQPLPTLEQALQAFCHVNNRARLPDPRRAGGDRAARA